MIEGKEQENRMTERQKFRETLYQIELLKRRKVQRFLLNMGLTPGQGQARILMYLSGHSMVSQKEIADGCMLDVTTLSRVLDKMEKMGLLLRERDVRNRRAYMVALTDQGMEKAEEVKKGFQKLEDVMCSGMSEREVSGITEALIKVRDNLKAEDGLVEERCEKESENMDLTEKCMKESGKLQK